jgi:hypothetical protein
VIDQDVENVSAADRSDFLQEARDRYAYAIDCDRTDREEAQSDNKFANASDKNKEQWDREKMAARLRAFRPVLQWNRIRTSVNQVVNSGRQNRTAIRVAAADGGKQVTADMLQSRIRHIEYDSNADTARDMAREQQISSGRGFIRYTTEYVKGKFTQKIVIEAIPNQFAIAWDPSAKKYDRSDADWLFIVEYISKQEHIRRYGKESVVSNVDFANDANMCPGWVGVGNDNKQIQIAQYWRKEYKHRTLALMSDGSERWQDELTEEELPEVVETREEDDCTVKIYVINGLEVLEETDNIINEITVVPYWGQMAVVDEVPRTYSLIRNSKDPQRMLNLQVSELAYQLANQSKTPVKAAVGAIPPNLEDGWDRSGIAPKGIAFYNRYDPDTGQDLGIPTQETEEPPIQALVVAINQSIDGIKAGMGIFDSSLGAAKAEYSGVSVEKRTEQADITNFHFSDNEKKSRKREGELLVRMISRIDQPGSNVPIRAEDGKTTTVPIGVPHMDPKTGEEVIHDLTVGDYGVTVFSGPSYDSARKEAYERDAALVNAMPELMNVIGDQLFAADDTAGGQERAERMKRWIMMKNPGLIQDPAQQQIPPAAQAQIAQLSQKLQTTDAFAQSLHEQLQSKQPEIQAKLQVDSNSNATKLEITQMQEETKRVIALATLNSQEAQKKLEEELKITHSKVDRLHDILMQHFKGQQAQDQAAQAAQIQQEQAEQEPAGANA